MSLCFFESGLDLQQADRTVVSCGDTEDIQSNELAREYSTRSSRSTESLKPTHYPIKSHSHMLVTSQSDAAEAETVNLGLYSRVARSPMIASGLKLFSILAEEDCTPQAIATAPNKSSSDHSSNQVNTPCECIHETNLAPKEASP